MNKYSNKYVLETGIGLQDVDGISNSHYFKQESERYVKGEISIDELDKIINSYYKCKPDVENRNEEADKVSIRIAKIISDDYFTFSVGQLLNIHRTLFDGIIENAGNIRGYNFIKKEWVLNGRSVTYGDYRELEATLQYDFRAEKEFSYKGLSMDEVINHLALFVANLWQNHVFEEGNTRTTAVFFIKYLRSLGFDVTNDTFAKNAWYFRNSLVRANYTDIKDGIYEDRSFLIKFLRNLLLGENNELKNRELRIGESADTAIPHDNGSKIIRLIEQNPKITTSEMAESIGVSLRTVSNVVSALRKNNKIKRINGNKYGYWTIVKD